MKNEQFRIKEEQTRRLREIADMVPGSNIGGFVRMAVDLWLEVEAPVYIARMKGFRQEVQERQAVRPVASIRPSERA